jgi:hypothetical protein
MAINTISSVLSKATEKIGGLVWSSGQNASAHQAAASSSNVPQAANQ